MFRSQPRALRDLGGERVPTSSQLCGTFQLSCLPTLPSISKSRIRNTRDCRLSLSPCPIFSIGCGVTLREKESSLVTDKHTRA